MKDFRIKQQNFTTTIKQEPTQSNPSAQAESQQSSEYEMKDAPEEDEQDE